MPYTSQTWFPSWFGLRVLTAPSFCCTRLFCDLKAKDLEYWLVDLQVKEFAGVLVWVFLFCIFLGGREFGFVFVFV